MFKRVLVPLDGTPESAVALPPARTIARATGAELVLVRVVPARLSEDSGEVAAAESYLDRIAEELAQGGHSVEAALRYGDAASGILDEIRLQEADLTVMATHGRSGLGRAVLGSVAQRVVHDSPTPVMLLRPGGLRVNQLKTLLVPADGTPGGALALSSAIELARAASARLALVEVVVPIPADLYPDLYDVLVDPAAGPGAQRGGQGNGGRTWDEQARLGAQSYLDRLVDRLRVAGVEASGEAILGSVPDTIVQVANEVEADAIVMSTHAYTGPARAFLGSVADAVVRTAQRPVLLVRRGARRSARQRGAPDEGEEPALDPAAPARRSFDPSA